MKRVWKSAKDPARHHIASASAAPRQCAVTGYILQHLMDERIQQLTHAELDGDDGRDGRVQGNLELELEVLAGGVDVIHFEAGQLAASLGTIVS